MNNIMDKPGGIKKPVYCDLIISESCMLKCKMCKMWQSNNPAADLGEDIWRRFIDSFDDLVKGQAQIQFVGGEPLLKKGVLGLIRHAGNKGFSTTMTTNAYLIDEKLARGIVDSGLDTIVISLDAINRQTHDFLRGASGVYDRVMEAIKLISKLGGSRLKIHIVATIMGPNLDELSALAKWVNQQDAVNSISFQALMQPFFTDSNPGWYTDEKFSFLWPIDVARVESVLDELIGFKQQGYKITNSLGQFQIFKAYFRDPGRFVKNTNCNLGYNSISVNTSGKIFLCQALEPIGDIRDNTSIQQLWDCEKAAEVRQQIRKCQKNCKSMINCFFEEE
jgi:MoaA/NifB/PqqE/SkfB family radical SAM enzyme